MKNLLFILFLGLLSGCVTTQQSNLSQKPAVSSNTKEGTYVLWAVHKKFQNNGTIFCPLQSDTELFVGKSSTSAHCLVNEVTDGFFLKVAEARTFVKKFDVQKIASENGGEIFMLKKVRPGKYFAGGYAGTSNAAPFHGNVPLYDVEQGKITYIGHYFPKTKSKKRHLEQLSFWASVRVKRAVETGVLKPFANRINLQFPQRINLACRGSASTSVKAQGGNGVGCWLKPAAEEYPRTKEPMLLFKQGFKFSRVRL